MADLQIRKLKAENDIREAQIELSRVIIGIKAIRVQQMEERNNERKH